MNKTEQARQLRLAAEIIETGHPFEARHKNFTTFDTTDNERPDLWIWKGYEIRITLATPPDGRPLHNPDNLTAEQVGVGYRLTLVDEETNKDEALQEFWNKCKWMTSGRVYSNTFGELPNHKITYRLPLSVPWPEAPKPEPTTKTVPLGPEDVPPGSVLQKHGDGPYYTPLCVSTPDDGVYLHDTKPFKESYKALSEEWQINRSIPLTGKWDANAWEPCHKTLANG